jgi:hypothetical protein
MTEINIVIDGEAATKIHKYAFLTSIVSDYLQHGSIENHKESFIAMNAAKEAMDIAKDLCIDLNAPEWLSGMDDMYHEFIATK